MRSKSDWKSIISDLAIYGGQPIGDVGNTTPELANKLHEDLITKIKNKGKNSGR